MNQSLKTNLKNLPTNYSSWVAAVLMGIVYYWLQLPPQEQQELIAAYPWLKHFAPIAGLVAWVGARVMPQGSPPEPRFPETRPMQ